MEQLKTHIAITAPLDARRMSGCQSWKLREMAEMKLRIGLLSPA